VESRWVVHIVDSRDGTQLQRCARCGQSLDINQDALSRYPPGGLLAIRHGQDRTEWRTISSRDDLGPDEVPCVE